MFFIFCSINDDIYKYMYIVQVRRVYKISCLYNKKKISKSIIIAKINTYYVSYYLLLLYEYINKI